MAVEYSEGRVNVVADEKTNLLSRDRLKRTKSEFFTVSPNQFSSFMCYKIVLICHERLFNICNEQLINLYVFHQNRAVYRPKVISKILSAGSKK